MASTLILVAWIMAIQTGTVPSPDGRQARLSGVVRDSTGAVVRDVAVTVSSAGTTPSRSAVTDAHGQYAIEGLLPGRHIVTAVAAGFGYDPSRWSSYSAQPRSTSNCCCRR